MDTLLTEKEHQQSTATQTSNTSQPLTDSVEPSPAATSEALSHIELPRISSPDPDIASRYSAKLVKMEEVLKSIQQTLNIHRGKEEVVTRSLVELETKINKIEKSLLELSKASVSSRATFGKVAKEVDSYPSQTGFTDNDYKQTQQSDGRNFARLEASAVAEQKSSSSADFAPLDRLDCDESNSFYSESTDDFDASSEKDTIFLQDEGRRGSGRERKKTFLIIIPVICLLALFIFLTFYYNSLEKQVDQKQTITEQISLTTVPINTIASPPAENLEQQLQPKPEILNTPEPSPVSVPSTEVHDKVISKPLPQQVVEKASNRFSVNVGSFKNKANAITLTSKLTRNGYPAEMAQINQKQLFRVSVGTFSTRDEALAMASRLQKKEKLPTAIISINQP